MPSGPATIFDKSTLQSLNEDEAAWFDNFYLSIITPLFFVETLADLEKQIARGRTPEQVVGSLASKTPGMQGVQTFITGQSRSWNSWANRFGWIEGQS